MLKKLKKLFIYESPSNQEREFRFPENPGETATWDIYRGKQENLEKYMDNSGSGKDQDINNDNDSEYEGKGSEHNKKDDRSNNDSQNNRDEKKEKSKKNDEQSDDRDTRDKSDNQADESESNEREANEREDNEANSEKRISENDNDHENEVNTPRVIIKTLRSHKPITVEEMIKESMRKKREKFKNSKAGNNGKNQKDDRNEDAPKLKNVSHSLKENIEYLENLYKIPANKDLIIRKFNIARKIPACLVCVDGMIDRRIVIQFALPELMDESNFKDYDPGKEYILDYIERNVLTIDQLVRMKVFDDINPQIVSGLTALFIEGCDECIIMESRGFEKRSVTHPVTETVISGPQEGFTEALRTNITLVRRIVKSENLVTEFEFLSKRNNFLCAILYMDGITNPRLVDEVKRRLKNLEIDYISGSGMLEQLIEDKTNAPFQQIIATERPDRVASFLMEGKVVIICEGTPFALAMPITFFDLFQTSEDSNLRWQYGSFLRIIRLLGFLLATFLPGMYTALILFHQEMIPTSLLSSIVASRAPVPFPTVLEILLMEFSFELIREGGIRVPGVTGNTLGIIGALILGQAAVQAGLVSPVLIIVVAVSGLGNFTVPSYSMSLTIRIIRIALILFGAMGGFYGISAAFTILMAFTLHMKSFGVPFFAPIAPFTRSNKDKIIRGPICEQTYRTDFLNTMDKKRMATEPRGWMRGNGGAENDQGR